MMQPCMPWASIAASRASRLRYAAGIGSSSPNNEFRSAPRGLRPRKYSSSAPGFPTGSKVGFGMNRFTLPPTSSRCLPSSCAHWMARFLSLGSM